MKYNRLILLFICLLFVETGCIQQLKFTKNSYEVRTINYINKAKSYIALHKKSIKIDTDNPVAAISVKAYNEEKTLKEIWVSYYNTNEILFLTLNKSGKITKTKLEDDHTPSFVLNKHNYRDMLSWNVIFKKCFMESIKFIKKKQISFNYKTSHINFYREDEDEDKDEDDIKHKVKYNMFFTDDAKKLVISFEFDSNVKIVKYEIYKDDRGTIDDNSAL
jgi:hypothetical protein